MMSEWLLPIVNHTDSCTPRLNVGAQKLPIFVLAYQTDTQSTLLFSYVFNSYQRG